MDLQDLYKFKGSVTRVVDGDTLSVFCDAGFHMYTEQRLRLVDVDTPERGQKNFKEATDFVKERIEGKEVIVQTYKSDVFGRYLAKVWYYNNGCLICLNEEIKTSGLLKEDSKWNKLD